MGRMCVKVAGREAGKICCIVKKLDQNFVLVTGPRDVTAVKRRKCNIAHLEPLLETVKIPPEASDAEVLKAYQEAGLFEKLKLRLPTPEESREREKMRAEKEKAKKEREEKARKEREELEKKKKEEKLKEKKKAKKPEKKEQARAEEKPGPEAKKEPVKEKAPAEKPGEGKN